MRIAVIGGGSWGTAFSALLGERDHEVTIVCRDAEQARTITATGHNPRYLQTVDLRGLQLADRVGVGPGAFLLGDASGIAGGR